MFVFFIFLLGRFFLHFLRTKNGSFRITNCRITKNNKYEMEGTKRKSPKNASSDRGVGLGPRRNSVDRFTIHYANVRGLVTNKNCAHQHLESRRPDILVLTETKVSCNIYENEFHYKRYQFEQAFEFQRGLCIFIKDHIPYSRNQKYEIFKKTAQTIVLKISLPTKEIFLISVYRSPNQTDSETSDFFETLSNKCDDIRNQHPYSELVMVGDFNAHHKEWLKSRDTNVAGHHAEWLAISHDLTQIVSESTFECQNSRGVHVLDLCLTSTPESMEAQVEVGIGNSDHNLVTIKISVETPPEHKQQPRRVWHYNKADYDGLRSFFQHFPWERHCFYNNNIDDVVSNFTSAVLHGMHNFIPSSFSTSKNPKIFSKEATKAAKRNKTAHKKYKRNEISFEEYKTIRNVCKKICAKEAKRVDDKKASLASQLKISDRNFFQMVSSVANISKTSVSSLKHADGTLVVDPYLQAELLANIFTSNSTLAVPDGFKPPSIPYCGSKMASITISEEIVFKNLKSMDINKATGPDGIPVRILKEFASELAPILSKIFLLSYKQGSYPSAWKNANVQPVLKRGCDKTDPLNYRPISIMSAVAKVFEKCVNQHIVEYLEINKIISDRQYGFRGSRSTTDLLTYVANKWNRALEQHGEAFAIALDISKAFDKVWHENLICKLVAYGFDSITIKWMKNFLNSRTISVVLNGVASPKHTLNAGVPQGSVLSPTLFLLYVNDLLDSTVNPIHSFADDATLHSSISFEDEPNIFELNSKRLEVVTSLNSDLSTIFEWGEKNLVTFNEKKTQVCTMSRKKSHNEYPFVVKDHILVGCDSIRLLGVQISNKLKWNEHIIALAKTASKKLGFLNRCRRFFKSHQVLQIYKTFIRPCVEYCCQVWGGAAGTTLQLLDRVQRRAIRIIRNPQLTVKLDSLQHRRDVAELCVFYRCIHGKCSAELKETIPPLVTPARVTRGTTNAHRFTVKLCKPRTEETKREYIYRTATKWNSLKNFKFPLEYNVENFKASINTYLKDRALGAETLTVTRS